MMHKLHLIVLLFGIAIPNYIFSQEYYKLQFPMQTSPYAGAEFHLMLHHELGVIDNRFVPSTIFNSEKTISKAGNILYRIIRMGTYEFYMTYIPLINQHEYFGHLGRAKILKAGYTRYEIYLFPPSGGRAYYGNNLYHPLTNSEFNSETIGGIEASLILAETNRVKALTRGSTTFQESMLYLGAKSDLASYILFESESSYNDIDKYLQSINSTLDNERKIDKKDLYFPAVLSMIGDPYALVSFKDLLINYLVKGEEIYETPILKFSNNISVLPVYSFELAPLSPRNHFETYIISNKGLYRAGLFTAYLSKVKDFGVQLGGYGLKLMSGRIIFDFDLRYWRSDKYDYHDTDGILKSTKYNGALLNGSIHYLLPLSDSPKRRLLVFSGIGLKTPGYTNGYPIAGGSYINIGIGYTGH
jgi:hypothetical protein